MPNETNGIPPPTVSISAGYVDKNKETHEIEETGEFLVAYVKITSGDLSFYIQAKKQKNEECYTLWVGQVGPEDQEGIISARRARGLTPYKPRKKEKK